MRKFKLLITLIFLTACTDFNNSYKGSEAKTLVKVINFKGYNSEYRGMGTKVGFDFYYSHDTTYLFYYSILCDSVYVFNVDCDTLGSQSFAMVSNGDSSKVLTIRVLSKDSLLVMREKSISIVNVYDEELYFSKTFSTGISVLSNFTQPQINSERDKIYCELIQWNAPRLKSGFINTDLVFEVPIKDTISKSIPVKFPSGMDLLNANLMFYFTLTNNKIIQSYSNSDTVDIFNLNSNKIYRKVLFSPELKRENIKSNLKSLPDRSAIESVLNSYFYDIFTDEKSNIYRIQSLPLERRTKEGFLSSIEQKQFRILVYNTDLELKKIIYPNYKGPIPRYFFVNNNNIYCLTHSGQSIMVYKIFDYE